MHLTGRERISELTNAQLQPLTVAPAPQTGDGLPVTVDHIEPAERSGLVERFGMDALSVYHKLPSERIGYAIAFHANRKARYLPVGIRLAAKPETAAALLATICGRDDRIDHAKRMKAALRHLRHNRR